MIGWETALGLGLKLWQVIERVWNWIRPGGRKGRHLPTETVRIVGSHEHANWWTWGKRPTPTGDVRVMAMRASYAVTAIEDVDVGLIRADISHWYWDIWRPRRMKVNGIVTVYDGRRYWSPRYPIPRRQTREVHVNWQIDPAYRSEGETGPLRARVYLIDQLGNAHTTRGRLSMRFLG